MREIKDFKLEHLIGFQKDEDQFYCDAYVEPLGNGSYALYALDVWNTEDSTKTDEYKAEFLTDLLATYNIDYCNLMPSYQSEDIALMESFGFTVEGEHSFTDAGNLSIKYYRERPADEK